MKKIIAILLSVVLLLNTIPMQTFATEISTDPLSTIVEPPFFKKAEPEIIGEYEEQRDENIKQFLLDDGSFLVCQYAEPVHYLNDGKWKDIDNSLVKINENSSTSQNLDDAESKNAEIFENKSSDVKIKFANKAKKENMIRIKQDEYQISWGILDVDNKPKFEIIEDTAATVETKNDPTSLKNIKSSGIYSNVFEGVDLRYTIVSKNIKEDILLNNKECRNEFSFSYRLNGLEMRLTDSGSIEIYDSNDTENIIYVIDKPYMYDSAEEHVSCNDISMKLAGEKGKYTITITADRTWLDSEYRVYPVVIDPTLQPDTNAHNIKDATRVVNSAISADARGVFESESEKLTMKVGYRYGSELQGLIYFNIPTVIPSSAKIINAQMAMFFYERPSSEIQVNAHLITSDWNTGVIDVNTVLYGNTTPTYNSNVIDFKIFSSASEYNYYMFDITSAVQKWSTGKSPNYGILLAAETVPTSTSYIRFIDSDHGGNLDPQYLFTYRDNKGLEDYWTYHTQSVGKAGTGYINDYSGNLVFVHNDITTTSERMTVSLDHVFDQSRLMDTATYLNAVSPKYGNGWRLSAVQRLQATQNVKIKDTYPYYYTDADGTEHYFKSNGDGTYSDEDGLGLTLSMINESTDNNTTPLSYLLTSKDKIKMKFDTWGFLRRITDTTNNTICFNYSPGPGSIMENNYLVSITDPSGRAIKLVYDSEYKLIGIDDFEGKRTSYGYNVHGQLTSITYPDGTNVQYTYDNVNCIDTVKDVELAGSGRYTIDYNLHSYAPYRVASITEYGTEGQTGQSISNIVYEHNQTLFTDNKGRTSTYQFDNWGCTTSVIDATGNASNYSYEHAGNKNNKFSSVGTSQKNINNYVMNSSAEYNSDWSEGKISADGSAVSGTVQYANEQTYMGNRSFYVNTEVNDIIRVTHMQQVTLKAGTYTLSAYMKTQNVHTNYKCGAGISILYTDTDGVRKWIDSKWTTGTTDWHRVSLTFTLPSVTNTFHIYVGLVHASGTAYFDCVQLEDGNVANEYNMIQNGSFEKANGTASYYWGGGNLNGKDGVVTGSDVSVDNSHAFKISGEAKIQKYITQTIPVTGNEGDIFSVSGWAKANSIGIANGSVFNITTRVIYSDGTEKWEGHDFNTCVEDWQYLSVMISTDDKNSQTTKTYTGIGIYFCYYLNENKAYIDHLQVTKDSGQSFSYDNDGNLISTANIADEESTFKYQNDTLSKLVNPDGSNYEYSYGYNNFNLMLAARSSGGVSYKFGYNMFYGYGTTDVVQTSGDKYSSTITAGKAYYIRNRQTGKNLQTYNNGSGTGTNIVQYTPNTSQYQKWIVRDASDGYYYLELYDSSGCKLSVKNSSATINQPLELNFSETDATQFKLVPNNDGIYYSIRSKLNETMAVCSNMESTANNNQILLYPYADAGMDREWYFIEVEQSDYTEPEAGKTYYISNYLTNQCIDVPAFRTHVNCDVTQYAYLGGTNQQIAIESIGEYYLLIPQHCTDKAFAVDSSGSTVTLQTKNNSDTNQHFNIIEQNNGVYRIVPENFQDKCISQQSATAVPSQPLKITNYTDELWQQWRFTEPIDYTVSAKPEDGEIYYIRFSHNYQYLDSTTMRSENGSFLSQYPLNTMLNQQFKLIATTDGYYNIAPMHTNKNILVTMVPDSSRTDGGGFIQLYEANGSAYQEFKFISLPDNTYRIICKASETTGFSVEVPNGSYVFSAAVHYAPYVGSNWQKIVLEKVGTVIRTSATYTDNKNYVTSITDAAGNTTQYDYNANSGVLNSITDAKENTTNYTYDSSNRISSITSGSSNVEYNYYSNSALEKILSPSRTAYNFLYDGFGNVKKIQVGSRTLVENTYNDNNGTLAQSTYGNGSKIKYQYDSFDYLKQKLYNDTVITEYTYDAQGRISQKKDNLANQTLLYEYDFIDRPISVSSSDSLKQIYNYDSKNRIESYTSTIGNITQKTGFLYGKDTAFGISLQKPGYLYGVTLDGTQTLAYEYDSLSRLRTKRIDGANHYKVEYEYYQGPNNEGTSQTTTMLGAIINGDTRLEYTYDELGNITSISEDGVVQESYTYDNLNQLKTVTRGSDVWEYTYDNGGNLTEVKQNGTVIKSYNYGDSEWKDLLTSYNNQTLTYDTIGNPLQYRDGYNFTWQNGRQLSTATNGSNNISYAYNSDGLRIRKTVNGTTTEYYWLEGSLLGQKTGNEYIIYLYDDSGSAYGMMITDGTTEAYYYYLFNAQGDIIGILDSAGTQVVEYTYDAWGNILSVTGTLANTIGQKNPLRYRGYYYDAETGFYYVSSRYYDPEIGRFISPDTTDILEVQSDLYDKNLYAYCDNNPVMRVDSSGTVWHLAIGAVVGIATQFIADVSIGLATGSSLKEVLGSLSPIDYVSAAISGAIAASGIGTVGAVVANAALGGTTYLANCSYKGVEANTNNFIASTAIGGVAGAIGGSGANGKNMRGVYSRSKQVINATKSTRKQAMYNAKVTTIKKNVTKSSIKTVVAGLFSNVGNFVRKLFSGSVA